MGILIIGVMEQWSDEIVEFKQWPDINHYSCTPQIHDSTCSVDKNPTNLKTQFFNNP